MGPTVQVLPTPGKDYGTFVQEQNFCRSQAEQAVRGQAAHQNEKALIGGIAATALGAGLGAAVGGGTGAGIGAAAGAVGGGIGGGAYSQGRQRGIQVQYNNAYVQCMAAYHNVIPGVPPVYNAPAPGGYYGQGNYGGGGYAPGGYAPGPYGSGGYGPGYYGPR
ncbi:glycine zipper family protein [Acetobacter garciniae]|uniref:glycine zipper family protein n=1 Tax=Acetobacter garciniae TaxID=2817435 RepID=UPI001E5C9704|nr:glycine zipper family protein [Acetobacter garciniae]